MVGIRDDDGRTIGALDHSHIVMAGLVPAIHALAWREEAWMPVTSTGMTSNKTGRESHMRSPWDSGVMRAVCA
jgi:hypothetical protein